MRGGMRIGIRLRRRLLDWRRNDFFGRNCVLDRGGEVVHLLSLVYQSLIVSGYLGNLVRPPSTVSRRARISPLSEILNTYMY